MLRSSSSAPIQQDRKWMVNISPLGQSFVFPSCVFCVLISSSQTIKYLSRFAKDKKDLEPLPWSTESCEEWQTSWWCEEASQLLTFVFKLRYLSMPESLNYSVWLHRGENSSCSVACYQRAHGSGVGNVSDLKLHSGDLKLLDKCPLSDK